MPHTPTDASALATYLKIPTDEYVSQCWAEATALVSRYVREAEVPTEILERAKVEVGAELYHRRNAPSGVLQHATEFGGTPTRLARDAMVAAYPLLRPYVGGGFG